jgi:hypothetical protein
MVAILGGIVAAVLRGEKGVAGTVAIAEIAVRHGVRKRAR